ncbi:MAG: enoyl-CoA hydratase/isomerase family protein [Planctomycetes bacterium]|nr:enoyl-CoA hydratase/isomerase family protein [Planctomycetota bacterium]
MPDSPHQFVDYALDRPRGVATLTLRRPPVNVLHIPMMEEIGVVLDQVNRDRTLKVLLIRGAGKCFCAGADVGDHLPERVSTMMNAFHRIFHLLAEIEIPTVSAVHGSCLGGGMELACFTDITLASSDAVFGQPEIKLGVFPPVAAAHYPALIGPKKTCELLFTGRHLSAVEALQLGLISDVYAPAEFAARAEQFAQSIAGMSLPALRAAKRAVRRATELVFANALDEAESIYMNDVMTTQDAREGLTSFLEKRKPVWQDR